MTVRPGPLGQLGRLDQLRPGRRAAACLLIGVLTGAAAVLVWASPATAHASLVRAVPGDGATVTSAPARVQLVFDENVRSPATVVITDASGAQVQRGTARAVDNTVVIRVDARSSGQYLVAFRVVSADGHPVAGTTSFRFASSGSGQPGSTQSATSADAGHHGAAARGSGFSRGRVIGIVAGAALLVGLGLLTVRRLPGGLVNPGDRPQR